MLPSICDGCGSAFSLLPAEEGWITQCHNKLSEALDDLAALAYKEVIEALFDVQVINADAPSCVDFPFCCWCGK